MLSNQMLKEISVDQYGYIHPSEIKFGEEIRSICANNVCQMYGVTWACPPAVGTLEQCKNKCLGFDNALVFNAVYTLEDSFDLEGMRIGHQKFKDVCDRLYTIVVGQFPHFLILTNEGCNRCEECTYPTLPCRIPNMLFPSIEGFGIYVKELAEIANIRYMNGKNTVTYFGMLLY